MASRGDDDRYGGGGAGAGAGAGGDAAFADSGDDRAAAILREGEAAIEDAAGARTDGAGGHGGSGGALANPLVGDLLRALRNEKAAPDLLPFQGDLVGTLSDMLAAQRAVLDSTPRSRLAAFDTVAALYEADVARLRYLLALYLRTRLAKIHRWVFHIATNDDARERLSPQEAAFHARLLAAVTSHVTDTALGQLPEGWTELSEVPGIAVGPNAAVHVFAQIHEELTAVDEATGEPTELRPGASAVLYRLVAPYVLQGKADLF